MAQFSFLYVAQMKSTESRETPVELCQVPGISSGIVRWNYSADRFRIFFFFFRNLSSEMDPHITKMSVTDLFAVSRG